MTATQDGASQRTAAQDVAVRLAPFIAWLVSREPREQVRRAHRVRVEEFLLWAIGHGGLDAGARHRYEAAFRSSMLVAEPTVAVVVAALDLFDEHRRILALTDSSVN